MADYLFTYPSVSESEELMMDDLTSALAEHDLPDHLCQSVMLAVSEAFTNALTHGNQYDPDKEIEIGLSVNEIHVVADIKDQGNGGLSRVAAHRPPGPLAESGRGISLIRHYADQVELAETPTGGLHVHIEFEIKKTQVSSS